jgi:hypothetical protein
MIQQPPPEEAVQIQRDPNKTYIIAWRVAVANHRAATARRVQVDGQEETWHRPGQRLKPIYHDIARYLERRGVENVERFITAQYFYSIPKGETLSLAPQLTSFKHETAWNRFIDYNRRAEKFLAQDLESARTEFQCSLIEAEESFPSYDDRRLWKVVLMNKMLDIPALFRYCVAVSEGLEEPAKEFRASAFEMFLTDPIGYCNAWGAAIPDSLKIEAETLLMTKL